MKVLLHPSFVSQKMTLLEALEIAKSKARSETTQKMWGDGERRAPPRCLSSICKNNKCEFLDYKTRSEPAGKRYSCKKTGKWLSNMFIHDMECQSKWYPINKK